MAKNAGQKKKLLAVLTLLYRETDEVRGISVERILSQLEAQGIGAERKSVYDDFLALSELGFEVAKCGTRPETYRLENRLFTLSELKMLTDAVTASRFVTAKDSAVLYEKLKTLAGPSARQLSRQVYFNDRARTSNAEVPQNIDRIHASISDGKMLDFLYFDYDINKRKVYRNGGETYRVAPLLLIRNNEYYYLSAFDFSENVTKTFRVDKMDNVKICKELFAEIPNEAKIDPEKMPLKLFGMYHGVEELVTLKCKNRLAGVLIDRFGSEPTFFPDGADFFRVSVRVCVSPNFFAWIAEFGGDVTVVGPEKIREACAAHFEKLLAAAKS